MTINRHKIALLARDAHIKQMTTDTLNKRLQREKTPELAAELAIAQVEYKRAKRILDNVMAEESVIIVNELQPRDRADNG